MKQRYNYFIKNKWCEVFTLFVMIGQVDSPAYLIVREYVTPTLTFNEVGNTVVKPVVYNSWNLNKIIKMRTLL